MNISPADKEVWRGANYNAAVIPFIWSLNCFDRCSPPQQLCNPPVGALNNTRPPPHLIYFCCEIICDIWNLIRVWLTDDCCVTRGQHHTTRLELSTKFCESFHKCFANTIHPLDIIIVNKHPNLQIFWNLLHGIGLAGLLHIVIEYLVWTDRIEIQITVYLEKMNHSYKSCKLLFVGACAQGGRSTI